MRRQRATQPLDVSAAVVHDVALLVAIFYAPIMWGAFNTAGQAFTILLVGLAGLAAFASRWLQGRAPAVIPNAVNLPALVFLAVSTLSALLSVSRHASAIEVSRLALGVLLFCLVANRALLPSSPPRQVAAAFACSALLAPFVRVPSESGLGLESLLGPDSLAVIFTGPGASLRLLTVVGVAAVSALILLTRERPDPVRWYLCALVVPAAFAVSAYGLREKISTYYILENRTWSIFSTFFNPNPLGGFLALAFFSAVGLVFVSPGLWRRLIWAFAALLVAVTIIPTHSKGAYLAFVGGAIVFGVLAAGAGASRTRNLRLLAGLCAAVVVAITVAFFLVPSVRGRATALLDVQSAPNMFRILIWQGTLRMAAANLWLGIGPGAFKYAIMGYTLGGYTEAAHQDYLQIFAEQGLFGLIAFLWLLAAALFTARRALQRAADLPGRLLIAGAVSGLTVLLVRSLLDYDWYIGAIGLSFWLLLGLISHHARAQVSAEPAARPSETPGRPSRRARRRAAPRPRQPEPEQGVHLFPWPSSAPRRVAAFALFPLLLYLCLRFPLANALAETQMMAGDQASAAALSAYSQRDNAAVRQHLETAAIHYAEATRRDPAWSRPWEHYGLSLTSLNRPEDGKGPVLRAVELDPTSFQPYLSLASYYSQLGQYREAVEAYRQSLARYPNNTRALRRLAATYQQLGDLAAAASTYRRMLEVERSPYNRYRALDEIDVDTEYAYAHYQLGRLALNAYLAAERPDGLAAAVPQLRAALDIIAAYRGRGANIDRMFQQVGKPREDRGPEMDFLESMTRWRLAAAYDQLGRPAEAQQEREKALALRPGVAEAGRAEDGGQAQ